MFLFSGGLQANDICVGPDTLTLRCIYTNFGPSVSGSYVSGTSYASDTGLSVSYTLVGIPFLSSGNFYLQDLEVAAFRANSDVPDSVQFSVYNNSGAAPGLGGHPGSALETLTLTGITYPGQGGSGTLTAASTVHSALYAGQYYWIVMSGIDPGNVTWNSTLGPAQGAMNYLPPDDFNNVPAMWGPYLSTYAQGAVALDGSPGAPEPGTLFLFAGGLTAAGLFRIRKRNK